VSRRVRRKEIKAGFSGGLGEGEAEERVGEGDGEAGEDAHIDARLAGAEGTVELLGGVAGLRVGTLAEESDERREVVRGDDVGQAVGRERRRFRREEMARDDDEEGERGTLVPARSAQRWPARRFHERYPLTRR